MRRGREATGVYVYCITDGEPLATLRSSDATSLRSTSAAAGALHPRWPVYSLVYEDLLAVVSQVPLEEFGEEGLHAHLEDASWLEREVCAHEQVIEKVMAGRTVLPMKFCTIFQTENRVQTLLKSNQEQFRRALARLRGRQEWEVKIYCEPAAVVARQVGKAGTDLSGKHYLLRKRAEKIAAQEAMNEAQRQAQRSYEKLAGWAEIIQLKPVERANAPSAPRLILDAVCLLPESAFDPCRQELERLGDELADKGFRFQLIGPWPPYHFTNEAREDVGLS